MPVYINQLPILADKANEKSTENEGRDIDMDLSLVQEVSIVLHMEQCSKIT
jgi:hypothetical protein